jgi:adenylate cyclase
MKAFRRYLYRHLHHILPLPILLVAFFAWLGEPGPLVQFRLNVFDEFLRLKPRQYEPTPVRIVDIDEDSLQRFGQWPWPRTLLAKLVDKLDEMGAAALAFDINFIDPDRTTPSRVIEHTTEIAPDDPLVARFKAMPDHDQVFADAIKRSHVVLGFALRNEERPRLPAPKASYSSLGDDPRPWVPHFRGAIGNLPELEAAATGDAVFDIFPERDGISRRVPLIFAIADRLYPALAIDALRVAQGAPGYLVKSTGASGVMSFGEHTGLNAIKVGNLVVPTGADGTVWLHFTPHQPERFVSASKILDGTADPDLVKDNIVVIGTTAEGLKEFRPTPLDPAESGAELHAQLIEQMLLGDILKRPDWARGAEIVFMLYIGIGLLLLLPRVGARWTALLGASAVTPAVCASWYAYYWYGLLIDPVFPSLVGLLVYLSSSAALFFRTETERRHVRHAFSRYLAPAVVEHLAEHPDRLKLGGELRELTIMFSDIRGFTTIAEGLDAQELTSFLNRYLTPMTDVIMSHDGTVDKYMADGIMAFWNAPLDDPRHAEHACLGALAMRSELARLNDSWRAEAIAAGRPFREVRAGIGLNTGECVVGNLGSDQRFDYSVLGDDANVASRLEGQTKTYHVDIILGERTAAQVPQFAMLELDLIQVVGKTRPVRIFFLFGDEGVRATSAFAALESAHDAMIRAYRRRDWTIALSELESCRAQAPEIVQYVYQLYERRIADLQASPPPADWDGVYAALMK